MSDPSELLSSMKLELLEFPFWFPEQRHYKDKKQ